MWGLEFWLYLLGYIHLIPICVYWHAEELLTEVLQKEEETDWTHILWWKRQIICYKSLYTMNCEEFKVYWNVSSAPSHWRTNNISSSQWLESCSVRIFFFSSSPWWNSHKRFFPQDPHLQCQANLTKEMFSKGCITLLLPLDCERLRSPWQLCFAHSWAAQVWPWGGRVVSLFLQELSLPVCCLDKTRFLVALYWHTLYESWNIHQQLAEHFIHYNASF